MAHDRNRHRLRKLTSRRTGWPVGTVAFYGPDDTRATKVVAAVVRSERDPDSELRKWYSDEDLRLDTGVAAEILAFFEASGVARVAMIERIIGCPHEYEGDDCANPECSYWYGRDRWTGEPI